MVGWLVNIPIFSAPKAKIDKRISLGMSGVEVDDDKGVGALIGKMVGAIGKGVKALLKDNKAAAVTAEVLSAIGNIVSQRDEGDDILGARMWKFLDNDNFGVYYNPKLTGLNQGVGNFANWAEVRH